MSTKNISLTPELEEFVDEKVQSGGYASASEVMRESLRILQVQDKVKELRLQEIEEKVLEGLRSLDRGEGISAEIVINELHSEIINRRQLKNE